MRTLPIALIIVLSASVAMAQRSTIIHKEQIEDAYIYNTGDTMEGDLIINGTATVEGVFNANDDVNVKYIDFDLLYTGGNYEGRLQWNNEDGTLEYGLAGGNVNLQIGQEIVVRVTNKTGTDIPDGSAVYVSGAQGQRPTIALASASMIGSATKVLGITTEEIKNNNSGYVTTYGLVRGVNTLAYPEGSILYLSESVPGGFQSTEPVSLRYIVIVGMVLYQHATEGVILACPKFYYNPAPFSITGVGAITVEKDGENYTLTVPTPVPTATAMSVPTPLPTSTPQPTATPQATPTPWSIITQGNISSHVDVSSVTLTVPTPAPTMIVEASGTNIIVTGTDDTWYIESPGNFPESLGGRYQETITSPTTTVYVNHGLGYQDVYVGIRDTVTNYVGMPSVILSTTDQVRIGFASAPTNPIEVVVIAGGYGSTGGGVTDHGSLTGLADYDHTWALHKTIAGTVTAVHTFSPSSVGPPFTLGMTADGQLVDGFNSDEWNGWDTLVVQGHGNLTTVGGNAVVTIFTPVPTATAITIPSPVPTATEKPNPTAQPTVKITGSGQAGVTPIVGGYNVNVPALPTATNTPTVTPTFTPPPTPRPEVTLVAQGIAEVTRVSVNNYQIGVRTPVPTATAKPNPTPQPTLKVASNNGSVSVSAITGGYNLTVPTPVPTMVPATPQPTPTPFDIEGSGIATVVQSSTGYNVNVPTFYPSPTPYASDKYFVFGDGTNTTYSWYIPSAGSYPIVRVREVVSPYREILCGINWSGDTFTFRTATPPAPNSLIAYCLPNDAMSVNQNPTHTLNSIDLIFTAYDVFGNVIQSPVTIVNTSTLSISSHIKVLSFKKLLYKESFAIGTKSMTVNHLLNQRNIIANVIYGGSVGTNISSYTYAMDSFTVGALSNYAGAVVVWEPLEFGNFELDLVAHPTPLPTATPFSVEGDGSVTVVKTESSYIVSVPTFAPTWTPRPTDTPPPTPAPTATEKPNPTAQPTLSITGSGAASVSSISGGYNVDVPTPAPTATIKPEPTAQPTVKITGSGSASITPIAGGYNVAVPTPVPTATIKPNPTPDGNKIDKVVPAPENKFPYFNSSGGIKDSGYDGSSFAAYIHNHDSYYISIIPDPSTGNFPLMTSGGELETSVFGPGSFATSSHNHNHNDLLNIDVNQHRTMNDLTTSSTTLWSSSKITSTLQGYIDVDGVNWQYVPAGTYHGKVDVPSKWHSVIAYDNYKLYTGSERFQISHSANVLVMDASTSDVQIKTEDKVFFSNSAGINSATVDVSESSIEADFGKFNFIQFKRDYTEAESSSLPNGSGFILDTGEEIGFGFKDLDGNVDIGRMYTADEIVSSVTLSDDAKYTYVGIKYDFDGNGTTDTKYLAMYKQ